MKCKFCSQETKCVDNSNVAVFAVVYACESCWADHMYIGNEIRPITVSLYTQIGDKVYMWTVTDTLRGFLWYVKDLANCYTRNTAGLELLKQFNDIDNVNVTPANVHEKIKTWLLII